MWALFRCILLSSLGIIASAQSSVLTWHNDNARTGQNLQETILTPANVNSSTFGKLFVINVDGKVDAQPLYVSSLSIPGNGSHNVLFVMTEHDSAYAFDADNGTLIWKSSLLGAGESPSDTLGCDQVQPEIGITATPVIDPQRGSHGALYVVAMSRNLAGTYFQRLHALDLATGAEILGGPTGIAATYPGTGIEGSGSALTFNPKQHKERSALLLLNGIVYTSWSSHCDLDPYTSWVIGYDAATLTQAGVLNLTPNGKEGGIWSAGSGPAADDSGNIYLLTGNGTFDTTLTPAGFPTNQNYGNSFVKISTAGRQLSVADYFTMFNTDSESGHDTDLGSGGVMLVPPITDSQGGSRVLAVGAGKDQNIYVVDRNRMGRFNSNSDPIYQQMTGAVGPVYSSPAWFQGTLYYAAGNDTLKAFSLSDGTFSAASVTQSTNTFVYPGATPSISANGTFDAIVWTVENQAIGVLHAYDAANVPRELYNSGPSATGRDYFGLGNKFMVPTVVNGKVYVGTVNGVGVFGLLSGNPASPAVSSVTNAASSASGPIAPGEIVTIKGNFLGPASSAQFKFDPLSGKIGSQLGGTQVLFGGVNAPVLYASSTQVNTIVPYELSGQTQTTVQVSNLGASSARLLLALNAAAPGIFTTNLAGAGQAAALNQDGTRNTSTNRAAKGSYVTLYLTGGGQTNPPSATGSVSSAVLKYLSQGVSVSVGGRAATVIFAGSAPNYVSGLEQIDIRLAPDTPSGPSQPVVISISGASSPSTATIAVQ